VKRTVYVIIPARLQSTRLSQKPLQKLGTKTLIETVFDRALLLKKKCDIDVCDVQILVATDSSEVQKLFAPGSCVLTHRNHLSGTDRIFEAVESVLKEEDIVLNIQGDEPFFSIQDTLNMLLFMQENPQAPMATLGFVNTSAEDFLNPNVVKIIVSSDNTACYFSRAAIPWPRGWNPQTDAVSFTQHIGIYAYRGKSLRMFTKELAPSVLESTECLEQLRAIEAGWKIAVVNASEQSFGIDTQGDLERARGRLSQ
jgi:3-deoxy-manno-octulosonate cytidylyltransferase (CMP-KDO synthetase)